MSWRAVCILAAVLALASLGMAAIAVVNNQPVMAVIDTALFVANVVMFDTAAKRRW